MGDDDIRELQRVAARLNKIPAIHRTRAARIIGIARESVYRLMTHGVLERIPRNGKSFVSIRSLRRYLETKYGSTLNFDALIDEP